MRTDGFSAADMPVILPRIHEDYRSVWEAMPPHEQAAMASYFLPRSSPTAMLCPTRPKVVKWYCPFAAQSRFGSGHRYCINVFVGCAHGCHYCYALGYGPASPACKHEFERLIEKDMADLVRFDVPPAPVHLSNSTDPFQELEATTGHTRFALEQILVHRHRFTTVTILTKNPLLPVHNGYLDLFKALVALPQSHHMARVFTDSHLPAFQVEVSLAFWREDARRAYDPMAPSFEDRKQAILTLRAAGIPVVLRIDPLFPRSPLPNGSSLRDFGLLEAQTLEDLESLVTFGKQCEVRHVVYSPLKIVQPRRRRLGATMAALRSVYQSVSAPRKPVWRGGSWRLPPDIADQHIVQPFLDICRNAGVNAKFCMTNLIETP